MRTFGLVIPVLIGLLASCSSDEPAPGWRVTEGSGDVTSYGDDSTVVITSGGETIISGNGQGCADISTELCLDPNEIKRRECGDANAQADIIVVNGEVYDVICYPPDDEGTPIGEVTRDADGNAQVEQNENGAVIIFNENTNGEPIEGDLNLTAERVSLFGNGVDNTIIGGNLTFSSNGSQVRGVTVEGDVLIDTISNNATLTFCKIHGDLSIQANNTLVANCQVFGNVTSTGNGNSLINIGVQGDWEINPNTFCDGCYSFNDANQDFVVGSDEVGAALGCGGEGPREPGQPGVPPIPERP